MKYTDRSAILHTRLEIIIVGLHLENDRYDRPTGIQQSVNACEVFVSNDADGIHKPPEVPTCVPTKFKLHRPGLGNRAVLRRFYYSNTTMIDGEFVPFPVIVIILAASTPDGLRKRYANASAGDDKART